jgi:tetratricopeptide (TPR) repeat protein
MHQLASWVIVALPLLAAQDSIKALFEAGKYDQVIERVAAKGDADRTELYIGGLSAHKSGHGDRANEWFSRLADGDHAAWKGIGESARALASGDLDGALGAATRAVAAENGLPWAHFQQGLVYARKNDFNKASEAFKKVTELDPSIAYGQYYAGLAFYRIRRADLMAVHFERFLKLAPNAPERGEVESIMRTMRGR